MAAKCCLYGLSAEERSLLSCVVVIWRCVNRNMNVAEVCGGEWIFYLYLSALKGAVECMFVVLVNSVMHTYCVVVVCGKVLLKFVIIDICVMCHVLLSEVMSVV